MPKKKVFSQSNYFTSYNSRSAYSKHKKSILTNQGIELKNILANDRDKVLDALNEIALDIQRKINNASLDSDSINQYYARLRDDYRINDNDQVATYIKICIILSKHSGNEAKVNWFGMTNMTASIQMLVRGIKKYGQVSGDQVQYDDFLPSRKVNLEYSYRVSQSKKERLKHQDQVALKIIKNLDTAVIVNKVSKALCRYINSNFDKAGKTLLYTLFVTSVNGRKSLYPMIDLQKANISSADQLLVYLEDGDTDHIAKLSILWPIISSFSGGNIKGINQLYQEQIYPTHEDYSINDITFRNKLILASLSNIRDRGEGFRNDTIGNSGEIHDGRVFNSQLFMPWVRSVEYIKSKESPKTQFAKECLEKSLPFISGVSGIANMYCKLLDILNISPHSEDGVNFMKAASAFIVAAGMHSYEEVVESFNLYINHFHKTEEVPLFWVNLGSSRIQTTKVDLSIC
ncbi:MAG: hypothetical protein EP298_10850 [Gammaproteobacteria bacterium]|nr:MAG: hypothetical protein EP298_10850 [Gammaproteobacteria bacterium]UTW41625.1 hypothetical protein KFE69_08910 [bacterium SCSIO 12844]